MSNNIAEIAGGIAVALMTYRTEFEIENQIMLKLIGRASDVLEKMRGGDDRKLSSQELLKRADERLAKANELLEVFRELRAASDRRAKAWPACLAWAKNQAGPAPQFNLVDKTFDTARTEGEEIDDAVKRGAFVPLARPKQQIDLDANVSGAMLRHRGDV